MPRQSATSRPKLKAVQSASILPKSSLCNICSDTKRDKSVICVVEQPKDIINLEKTALCKWIYHVLGGHIAPLEGIDADNLNIKELVERVKKGGVSEIVMATNPNYGRRRDSPLYSFAAEKFQRQNYTARARSCDRFNHRICQHEDSDGCYRRQTNDGIKIRAFFVTVHAKY